MTYSVISLHRPWAAWVAGGLKAIEKRLHNRFACLAGKRILIHATKKYDYSAIGEAREFADVKLLSRCDAAYPQIGAIICSAFVETAMPIYGASASIGALIDCVNHKRFGLYLKDIFVLPEPIFCKGGQGIWKYELKEPNL